MEIKKMPKKSSKNVDVPASSSNAADKQLAAPKPAKRSPSATAKRQATKAKDISSKSAEPKKSTHRHSKLNPPVLQTTSLTTAINYEEVAKLAYQYWEERNFAHGFAEDDWHRAEKAIKTSV